MNLDVGQWCHLNCALWSTEVYETVSGALMSVEQAFKRSINTECASCKQKGASLTCFAQRCPNAYHFPCAVNSGCVFYKNKVSGKFLFLHHRILIDFICMFRQLCAQRMRHEQLQLIKFLTINLSFEKFGLIEMKSNKFKSKLIRDRLVSQRIIFFLF